MMKIYLIYGLLVSLLTGCGPQQTMEEGAKEMPVTEIQNELFPETKFESIQFKPAKREQPKTAKEAITALDNLRELYDWSKIPQALNQELSEEKLSQYVQAWQLLHKQMPNDIEWLEDLFEKGVDGADNIERQTIANRSKTQIDWLKNRLPKQLEDSAKYTRQFMEGCVAPMMWNHIEKAANCDMSNSTMVTNLLARPNINQLRNEQIKKVALAFDALQFFDQEMGIDSDWATPKKKFRDMVARYEEKLAQAAEAIQPPQDINNSELSQIAADVLGNKKYSLGKIERIIVNAPKRAFGKDHYTIDFSERSIEKSNYRWEEFQAATIEETDGKYYLWYNTLIKYSEGPHTVPTGQWVLGPRHRSAPISQSNIGK